MTQIKYYFCVSINVNKLLFIYYLTLSIFLFLDMNISQGTF